MENLLQPLNWEMENGAFRAITFAYRFYIIQDPLDQKWYLNLKSAHGYYESIINWNVESPEKGKDLAWEIWVENISLLLKA